LLDSNDAFLRFKKELGDYAEPFKNEAMWNKSLWDGSERVRFELPHTVSKVSVMDRFKLLVTEIVGVHHLEAAGGMSAVR
jgi:hypothetical protein